MKTSAILITAAAALVSAQYTVEADNTYKCDKPNTNYCIGGDIILRCDTNGTGTPGRCSANLSGYPPAGGLASCYESAQGAGDAACEKNVSYTSFITSQEALANILPSASSTLILLLPSEPMCASLLTPRLLSRAHYRPL